MKYILLILMSFSFSLKATSLNEAAGFKLVGANDNIKIKWLNEPSDQDTLEHLKTLSENNKGKFGNLRHHAATGVDFDGRTSNFEGGSSGKGDRTCKASSTEQFVDHEIKIKNGEILSWIDVWGEDSNVTEDMAIIVYRQCYPSFAEDAPMIEFLLVENMPNSSGDFIYSMYTNKAYEDTEEACKLMARVRFGQNSTDCSGASGLSLYKFRAEILVDDLIFIDNLEDY